MSTDVATATDTAATSDTATDTAEVSTDAGSAAGIEADLAGFDLPVCADIRMAAEIRDQCLAALSATGDVRVGCGHVERVDAAVLQCLGALALGLSQVDRGLELVDRTLPFDRAVDLLGFGPLLAQVTSGS